MKIRYEEMLPHEIVEARTACPVAYLPVGGLEWHGEHNCVGLDTVKIHALAMLLAERLGGIAFPALFYGENRESHFMEANSDPDGRIADAMRLPRENFAPGYMGVPRLEQDRRYVDLLVHILFEIRSLGFRVACVMAGHYPLLAHARAACELFGLEARDACRAWAFSGYDLVRDTIPDAGDHAAAWETSLMLALRPDLVDLSRLPADPETAPIGVFGRDPRRHASIEYGRRGIEAIAAAVGDRNARILRELGIEPPQTPSET